MEATSSYGDFSFPQAASATFLGAYSRKDFFSLKLLQFWDRLLQIETCLVGSSCHDSIHKSGMRDNGNKNLESLEPFYGTAVPRSGLTAKLGDKIILDHEVRFD